MHTIIAHILSYNHNVNHNTVYGAQSGILTTPSWRGLDFLSLQINVLFYTTQFFFNLWLVWQPTCWTNKKITLCIRFSLDLLYLNTVIIISPLISQTLNSSPDWFINQYRSLISVTWAAVQNLILHILLVLFKNTSVEIWVRFVA